MARLACIYRKNIYSPTDWGEECRGFPLQNAVSSASELESPPETGLLLVVLLTIFYFASASCWIFLLVSICDSQLFVVYYSLHLRF